MSFDPKRPILLPAVCAAGLIMAMIVSSAAAGAAPDKEAAPPAAAAPKPSASLVQHFESAEKVEHAWGWIRWLMSSKTDPEAEMTFGIVHVKAGQQNPLHVHPNCAEYLHVLSGSCEHLVGKKWHKLEAGDTIRIPAKVPHGARTLDEPMRAVIVYNTGDRQFVPVEDEKTDK